MVDFFIILSQHLVRNIRKTTQAC